MLTDDEFDDLCRRLYRSVRDGTVDREAAFDLSAEILATNSNADWSAQVTELAADVAALAMAEPGEADPALADSARELMARCLFKPTFEDEPRWLVALQDALEIVKADLRACGLPDAVRLLRREGSRYAYVDAWAANSTGSGIYPEEGKDPINALVVVADDAQDAVMHSIWGAWPACPEHRHGVHALKQEGAAVWWCAADGGHVAARVGQWPRSLAELVRAVPGCRALAAVPVGACAGQKHQGRLGTSERAQTSPIFARGGAGWPCRRDDCADRKAGGGGCLCLPVRGLPARGPGAAAVCRG